MLNVGKIEEGFVLDHIKAGKSLAIYHHLQLDKLDCRHAQRMSGIFRTGWSVTLPERDRWTGVSSNRPLLLQMI